jgi:heme-degrading monooxygenase HmoA
MSQRPDSILDFRVRTTWKRGPAAESTGPFLVSYTEFTPHTMRDVPGIYFAAEKLRSACAELEGVVGVAVYWQLFRRRGGSLSVWEDEAALQRFVSLPLHVEIMRRYRDRGSLRAIDWQAESFALRTALEEGQRALDEGKGRQS